jgi:hypothetical protein
MKGLRNLTKDAATLRRRLREDRATNIALIAALVAILPLWLATLMLNAPTRTALRAGVHVSPEALLILLLIVLPLIFWISGALSFSPWALRLLRPVLILAPLGNVLALVDAYSHLDAIALATASGLNAPPEVNPFVILSTWLLSLAISVTAALIGWLAYSRSLLAAIGSNRVP